ncbi:MAG: thiamine pyrophosphate-binding protein [Myxococcota bacterium]
MSGAASAVLSTTVAGAVVALLESLGVRRAYGLTGGPIAPFCDALGRSTRIRTLHCRHESGAAFAALEDSLASGELCAVFVTTGPGITNALTGICAARSDGGRVLLISASTSARETGRGAFQETSPVTLPVEGIFRAGPIFHSAFRLDEPAQLPAIAAEIALGLARPQGWVGHLTIPIGAQTELCAPAFARVVSCRHDCDPALIDASVARLDRREFAIWAGFGARGASAELAELAARTGAAVMCSPRAKGVFPEDHPQYLGVTGFGGHERVKEYLFEARPERILVLGSRLGEFTSFWDLDFVPSGGFVHVDLDPCAAGAAYPEAETLSVSAEIGSFLRALLGRLSPRVGSPAWTRHADAHPLELRARGPVRPAALMAAVQRAIVDASDAIVLCEAGNAFAWGTHALSFRTAGRYRTSTLWGAMGHASCGVIGATLARGTPGVALVGDGAMLMQTEISTAVQYGIPAVWIVLNDGLYGMIEQGMRAQGLRPLETKLPATDFAAHARALGAQGVRVEHEPELDAALAGIAAPARTRPIVVDVRIDPAEPAPFLRRVQSLVRQTSHADPSHSHMEVEA